MVIVCCATKIKCFICTIVSSSLIHFVCVKCQTYETVFQYLVMQWANFHTKQSQIRFIINNGFYVEITNWCTLRNFRLVHSICLTKRKMKIAISMRLVVWPVIRVCMCGDKQCCQCNRFQRMVWWIFQPTPIQHRILTQRNTEIILRPRA